MLIVQKYGGTSLAGMSRLRAAARRVTGLARQGNQVVVVVSAQGDTTDMLIEKATQVNRRGSAREMDAYLAAGEQMDITTLGRGGSDTTAVALAAWLKADRCQIFTDVDGVYDRDPRIYSDATRFGQISYAKMMTLIENGAQVLHDRSVELAREHGIPIEVLSAFTGDPGTIVGDLESYYPTKT